MRSGADGANLARLDVLASEHVAERFDEVVLVWGDGIFADAIGTLASRPAGASDQVLLIDAAESTAVHRLRVLNPDVLSPQYPATVLSGS
jgi:hypothetical protein